ncbi:MAG TPA: hypothetical protein VFM70_09625 [Salinimicrobium sp.]|nr:hypothetical protein [Salinimicrobium sp.]
MKIVSFILSLLFLTATCQNSTEKNADKMQITGTIEQQGITTYQYGTHTISSEEESYALKSDAVNLDNYLNQEVTITAEKITGYPVDGGPEYLLVLEVE